MSETAKEKVLNSLQFLNKQELLEINQKINALLSSNINALDHLREYFRNMKNNGQELNAIKEYKEKTGCSLKEAKEYIDGLQGWPLALLHYDLFSIINLRIQFLKSIPRKD